MKRREDERVREGEQDVRCCSPPLPTTTTSARQLPDASPRTSCSCLLLLFFFSFSILNDIFDAAAAAAVVVDDATTTAASVWDTEGPLYLGTTWLVGCGLMSSAWVLGRATHTAAYIERDECMLSVHGECAN